MKDIAGTPSGWLPHLPPGVDRERPINPIGSLTDSWLTRWSNDPSRPTLSGPQAGWLSAAEVEEASRAVAGRLLGAGLVAGDRIVISAGPTVAVVVAYVGALRAGLAVVPVNTAYRQAEVAHIVADAKPRAAVVDDAERGRWIESAAAGTVIVTDPAVGLPDHHAELAPTEPDDPALIIYTSGTTGKPKGALLSHGNLVAGVEALRLAWRWTPDDRLLHTLPLFHLHGLGAGINGSFHAGASVVLRPRFDAVDVLDGPTRHDATLFFGVPTMYGRLADHPAVGALAGYRLCVSGSAPLPPDMCRAIRDGSGQAILERYGMTETMLTISNPYDGERRPGTVGFPLPGVEIRLRDSGEMEVRGPSVFAGYWGLRDTNADVIDADGWFCTGDIASFDDDGYVRIVGRMKELIITGGYNVYPREVEEALQEHPGIAEAAVRGVASARWGEAVSAWVIAEPGLTEEAVLEFARSRLAPYKCPKTVRFVDSLPRNSLGKILKHELD